MSHPDFAERLHHHASLLLDRSQPPGALRDGCIALFEDCSARVGELASQGTELDCGTAISTLEAARCVLDFQRTTVLLRAVDDALRSRLERLDGIEVLYAGCGPFAPLLLPLLARYPASRLRATLLDVHAPALAGAQRLCADAGVADRLRPGLCADAARVRLPRHAPPQVLILEVMQRALEKEPQLAVLANLVPQCAPALTSVPHRIRVSAELADLGREFDASGARRRLPLGELMELSCDSLPGLVSRAASGRIPCPAIHVPADAPAGLSLMLRTQIEAGPGHVLGDYDSGLTYPLLLGALGDITPGERFDCDYRLGARLGFELRRAHGVGPGTCARADSKKGEVGL